LALEPVLDEVLGGSALRMSPDHWNPCDSRRALDGERRANGNFFPSVAREHSAREAPRSIGGTWAAARTRACTLPTSLYMQPPTPPLATALPDARADARRGAVEAVLAGTSPLALELVRAVERASDARTVVVRGPAGSGRRQVAQALHRLGSERLGPERRDGADAGATFVRCAGLSGTWGVQRLLGTRDEAGLFDVARGGTLVLVDAERLEHDVQSSIAEALGRGAFTPLGARAPRALDLRLVALTSDEDLERVLAPELAYRLNDHAVHVPSLALRAADLPDITRVLLAEIGGPQLSAAAARELSAQVWIGGIDELAELVARAARAAGAGPIEPQHLGERRGPSASPGAPLGTSPAALLAIDSLPLLDRSWRAVEKALIERVLLENDGNKSRAARVLGFNRSTLYHKLAEHGLA